MAKPWRNFTLEEAVASILRHSRRDEATGCLLYKAHRNEKGYGRIGLEGVYTSAHRVMFMSVHGRIDSSVHVLHRCDQENCCEPDHLFRGDNFLNQQDRVQKGRFTKLQPEDVARIQDMLACRVKQRPIADWFGIGQDGVSRINTGQYWGHLPVARV